MYIQINNTERNFYIYNKQYKTDFQNKFINDLNYYIDYTNIDTETKTASTINKDYRQDIFLDDNHRAYYYN